MIGDEQWESALHRLRESGSTVGSLDERTLADVFPHLSSNEPHPAARSFVDKWLSHQLSPWEVLLQSASAVSGERTRSDVEFSPFAAMLDRGQRAALVFTNGVEGRPAEWSYLLQIAHPHDSPASSLLRLHTPASPEDLKQVEYVLGVALPPSFQRFLRVTNGLSSSYTVRPFVYGAGPSRAKWSDVQLNLWMKLQSTCEVTALWREFQGTCAYERIMDRERGEDTFVSNEKVLIPFGYTFDEWCFDWSRPTAEGEFPVVFWDHELRKATEHYATFANWLNEEVESCLFGLR